MSEFRIQQCLGRGGFGEVYKAVMSRGGGVEMDVAIKVLRPDLDPDSQGVKRLKDEGNLLGRLTHPTILRVYGFVEVEGRSALVTEYVPGDDLARLLQDEEAEDDGPVLLGLPPRAAFEIIAQVAAALDAAWSWPSVTDGKPFHLVHRDIKPDNIRIDPHGGVKLLDFGISLASTVRREAHTSVNTIMGSTQYLAPERLVQQEVGPESDVFALGCTLYEALTGEALFARKSMRQMYMLMVDEQRFEAFVTERCTSNRDRLGGDRATALIRAMTTWRKQNRPTAAEVAARCDMIGDSTSGPTLTQWCRERKWPPPPTIDGPLEGVTFKASHPLSDTTADTLTVRPPAGAVVSRSPKRLDDTVGYAVGPPFDDETTDGRLRTDKLRATVLGEMGHAPHPAEVAAASSAAREGPLPWSEAEMVALWAEQQPTRRISREEVLPPRRYPQVLRQRPGEEFHPGSPELQTTPSEGESPSPLEGPTTGPTSELVPVPPDVPDIDLETDPSLPAVVAPPAPEPPPPPPEPPPPQHEPVVAEPPKKEESTIRLRRNTPPERTIPLEPVTGPISDQGGEPTQRLAPSRPERTIELPPEARESTIPGIDMASLVAESLGPSTGVDEVARPLGPDPAERSDADEENTESSAPPQRGVAEVPEPVLAPTGVVPPPEAPELPSETPMRRSRSEPGSYGGSPRLIAIGASSILGLVFGMGLLVVVLLIVLLLR